MAGRGEKNGHTTRVTAEMYKDFVDNARDLFQCVDSEGKFIFVNQAWLTALGYAAKEIDKITLWNIIHPDSMEHCQAVFEQVLAGKAYGAVEAIFVAKDGTPIAVEGNVGVKLDENGRFVHTRGVFRNVTDRKQAEEALKEREEKYRALFSLMRLMSDTMPDMLWAKDLDKKYIFANEAICKNLLNARDTAEPIGKTDLYFADRERNAHPEQPDWHTFGELCMDSDSVTLKEMKPMQFDEYGNVKGKFRYLDVHKAPLFNDKGKLIGIVGTARDVTDQKRNEESLRESEEKHRFLAENMGDIIWTLDLDFKTTFVSPSITRILGYTPEERKRQSLSEVMVPESQMRSIEMLKQELACEEEGTSDPGRSATIEVEYYHRDGSTVWMENIMRALRDEEGRLIGIYGISRDISERKQAEESLRASEKKYREILSTIEEGYYEVDLAGNFVFFNDSFWKGSGYSKDELMQGSYKKLYKNPQEVMQTFSRIYRTGIAEKAADWPVITKDGREIFIEVSISLRCDEKGNPIGFRGIARDITERKLAEEKLREHEKLQQLLMNMATDLINVPLEKIDQTINWMLKAVGEFTKADRVYIFKHDYGRRVTSNTYEWCAEGITPKIDNLQDFPLEKFADYLEAHQKGEVVHIPSVAQMPANHALRPFFEAQGIQSVVMLPTFSEDVNTGFVGFDTVRQQKTFTEQEINLLKILAVITSNVLTRQEIESNIRYISFHDQLTGLYNRHFLEEEMARLNTKRQLPLAVIMADLNGLKLVNDTYGHATGDKMLIEAANIIRNSCRGEDVIARWGGDEFVILLPQTTVEETWLICKRITESCQNSVVGDVPVSIALGIATKASETKSLIETLQESETEMYKQKLIESRSTKSAMVASLLNILAAKSFETEEHTRAMQEAAQIIGAKLNLPDSELHRLDLLIDLHDIGKVNIAENILTKKSSLTAEEWEAIRKHPEIGYRIAMATEEFAHVAEDILAHHERWDGAGYPQGLKGENIPLLARITAVADAYEVMSSGRPYKKAMSRSEIIAEFKRCAGTHFDPELVKIFLSVLEVEG